MDALPKPERALVLEDQTFQREVAASLLKACGVREVLTAATGDEALEIARSQDIHVLLCDLQTPGMDGVELLRHVAEGRLAHAVIIASALEPTLVTTVEEMAISHGLKVLGTLEKPLTRDGLSALLARYRIPQASEACAALPLISLADIEAGVHNDEFVPYFQPKVALATRKLVGLEALIRWQHPVRGLVPPLEFIPLAEPSSLIHDLTWLMVRKSLEARKLWGARVEEVSVNFSMNVITDLPVVERLCSLVREHQATPTQILIEVTESALARNTAHMLETLARLRIKGFGLSIDDFGTGYSSMQQLSRIAFTELKIDKSFVHGAASRRQLRNILESSLDLARKMNLKSVAEGVETPEDWQLLAELGCDVAQGYLIAKPMPAEQLWPWYDAWLAG
jgi:EAL domain-containing protein (putative c-di-GMP-specific phosphodiesterase class I)/ActR/RegA family two-component response regulator